MTQDTKYLDAYIKSNFNLKNMHNEFADKKDLDELNNWLNSDKYKEIINSDEINYYDGELILDANHQLELNKFFTYRPTPNAPLPEDTFCLKELIINKKILQKILKDLKKLNFAKLKDINLICENILSDDMRTWESYVNILTDDPSIDEFFEGKYKKKDDLWISKEIEKIQNHLEFHFSDGNFVDSGGPTGEAYSQTSLNQDKFLLTGFTKENHTIEQKKRILEKRGSFRTLAEKRMAAAIESIRKISNCSNKSHYAYSYEEIKQMRDTLIKKVNYEFSKFGFNKDKSLEIKIGDKQFKNPKGNSLEIELESLKKSMNEKFRELELKINLSDKDNKK